MPHLRAGRPSCRALAALLLFLSTVGGAAAEPLRIRYSVWVGYGPLFLAKEKGYFKAENVDVQLVKMEDPKESYQAMGAGRLDGVVSTVDTVIPHLRTGAEFQYVLALDDSAGGDGIVARKEIKSVRDLRGKRVAVQAGSVSQFFLNVLLRDAGLSEKDVQVVNMKPGDAGAAFVAGAVDAAVTWEPWLSNGKSAPHGHMLVDSSQTPGLITDVLVFRREVIEKRAREIQGVVDAWHKAVAYWEKNPGRVEPDHGARGRRVAPGPAALRRRADGREVLRPAGERAVLRDAPESRPPLQGDPERDGHHQRLRTAPGHVHARGPGQSLLREVAVAPTTGTTR